MPVVEVHDFERDVIEASRRAPVVADFWAPWCGPCRQLSPLLERLAEEHAGQWTLAKINTDEQPEPAQRYHVRGIPAVKLFVDGEVVDEFTGALPESGVRQWLERALTPKSNKPLAAARKALAEGREEEAEQLLWEVLDGGADGDAEAHLLLARLLVFRDPLRARSLLESVEYQATPHAETGEAVATVLDMMQRCASPEDLPDGAGRDTYLEGLQAVKTGEYADAFDHFIRVIQTDRGYEDDAARKACVALFAFLGEEHPVTQEYRRPFSMSLY